MEQAVQVSPKDPPRYPEVFILKHCPLCHSTKVRPTLSERIGFPDNTHLEVQSYNDSWVQLLECENCSFAYCKEIPTGKDFFAKRYDYGFLDPKTEVEHIRKSDILIELFKHIDSLNSEKGKLLDVGSFAGKLLRFAADQGFSPEGIEVNSKMGAYTEEVLGYPIHIGDFKTVELKKDYYQVVTIVDVLEHLFEPRIVLENLHATLKTGGILAIKVPNYKPQRFKQWMAKLLGISDVGIFSNFGHINQFTPKSIEMVAESIGFKFERQEIALSEQWEVNSLSKRLKNFGRNFYFFSANLLLKTTGINIGFNAYYFLRKK